MRGTWSICDRYMNVKQISFFAAYTKRFAVLLFLVLLCLSVYAQKTPQDKCIVAGTVFDTQDAVVLGSRVLFRNQIATKTVHVDQEGDYELELPSGLYNVLIVRGMDFWNYMRSEILVDCDSKEHINLYVMPECVSYGCARLGAHFDIFASYPNVSNSPKLLISYFDRKPHGSDLVYSDVVLTFDKHTVRAKEVLFNKNSKKLVGRHGWSEAGGSREMFDVKSLEFADSILKSKFELRTVRDEKNVKGLRKLYTAFKESGEIK